MIFARLARTGIRRGHLSVIDAHGVRHDFGPGGAPAVTIRFRDPRLHSRLFLAPWLAAGEAYMDGTLTIEAGSLYDLIDLAFANERPLRGTTLQRLGRRIALAMRWLQQHNPVGLSRRNVAHHYDLSLRLFELFLDRDVQYSCAYFRSPHDTLEEAQLAKKSHIAAKLLLEPGMRVLDIGCGWGGLALFLARTAGVEVTGITLSKEQLEVARTRAQRAGLGDRVRFALRDYREEIGTYDRIVSVGMFEHVGIGHFPEFFGKVRDLLTGSGVALLHSIGRSDGPGATNPWLRKYIFPGGYSPALSEVLGPVEHSGLWVTDIEVLRLHYAMTLRRWRENFAANRDKIRALYDERFCRMWEFYLAGSELSFRHGFCMVFQMQLAASLEAVPLTRDYMIDRERALLQAGSETGAVPGYAEAAAE